MRWSAYFERQTTHRQRGLKGLDYVAQSKGPGDPFKTAVIGRLVTVKYFSFFNNTVVVLTSVSH